MIKEALQDDQPLPPEQSFGTMSREPDQGYGQTKAETFEVTPKLPLVKQCPANSQAYARVEVGQKLGIDPPNTPICFDGANNPIAVIGDVTKVKTKPKTVCKLPEIRSIQQMYNKMVGADKQIKEDGILGKNTKMAISYLASSAKVDQGSIPKACDRKAYAQLLQKLSSTIQPAVSTQPVAQTSLGLQDQSSLVLNKIKSMKLKDVAGVKAAVEAELKPMRSKGPITEKEIDAAFNAARENFPGSFSTITSLEESWVNKNKHKYSNNLFERLVKDASKNKRL